MLLLGGWGHPWSLEGCNVGQRVLRVGWALALPARGAVTESREPPRTQPTLQVPPAEVQSPSISCHAHRSRVSLCMRTREGIDFSFIIMYRTPLRARNCAGDRVVSKIDKVPAPKEFSV